MEGEQSPRRVELPRETDEDRLFRAVELNALTGLSEAQERLADDDDDEGGTSMPKLGKYQGIILCGVVLLIGWVLVQFFMSLIGVACDFPGASLILPFCKGHSVCGVASSICKGVSGLARGAFHDTEDIGRTVVHAVECFFSFLGARCGSEVSQPPSIFGWFVAPKFTTVDIDAGTVTCSDPTGEQCEWPLGASGTIHATVHCRPSECALKENITSKIDEIANTVQKRAEAGFKCPWDPLFQVDPDIITDKERLAQRLRACVDCWPACTAEQTSGDCLCSFVCFLPDGYVSYGVQERSDLNDLDSVCEAYSSLKAMSTDAARRLLAPFMQTLAPRCGSIVTLNVTRFIDLTLERNACPSGPGA